MAGTRTGSKCRLAQGIGAGRCPFAGPAVATPDSGSDVNVTSPADLWRDQPIIDAIDRWSAGDAPDSLTLAKLVSDHIRAVGKHFLSVPILTRLTEIRRQHGARDPFLDAFLDGVLDKFEGRYYNRTYLALPLLERICDDPLSGLDPERMSALLMADIVRFETAAAADESTSDRPDPATSRKRITHALRFVASCRDADGDDAGRDLDLAEVLETLPALPATPAGEWFDMTVQPVYVAHDEYFFMRSCRPTRWSSRRSPADCARRRRALRGGRFAGRGVRAWSMRPPLRRGRRCCSGWSPRCARSISQPSGSSRRAPVRSSPSSTSGSRSPCGDRARRTAASRRRSRTCPRCRPRRRWPATTISPSAYLDARRDGTFTADEWDVLDAALNKLEGGHQRWKATHHSLAARMLGEAHGSGYTAGVPYLRKCLDNRLFWRLGDYLDGSKAS